MGEEFPDRRVRLLIRRLPARTRSTKKLLLHAQEIKRIDRRVREKGYTLIPLSIYLKRGLVKIELGLCKGKKMYDKRSDIRDKDMDRDMQRALRRRNEG